MAIATLIAAGALEDRHVEEALHRLGGGSASWLDEGDAARVRTYSDPVAARAALGRIDGIDTIVTPDDFVPRLFIADMDSTMIGQECIDELAKEAGVGERVADITERAMRGELDFRGALWERLQLLEGLECRVIDDLLAHRITPNAGAGTLIRTLKANGVRCILVSGGFTAFAGPVGAKLGFDRVVANVLGTNGPRLSGKVEGDIVDSTTKLAVLREEMSEIGVGQSIAIGDGANDLPMIEASDLGIAYRAKPKVAEAADARLDHSPLDALLWALGIKRADWVLI